MIHRIAILMLQNSTIHVIDLNQIGDCKMKSLLTTLQGLLVREPSDLTSQIIAKMDVTIHRQYQDQQVILLRTDYLE